MSWSDRILVVAPHADDETLGCGGLLLRYKSSERFVWIATLGRTPATPGQQTTEELGEAMGVLGVEQHQVGFPGQQGRLDTMGVSDIVSALDEVIAKYKPTSVFVPYASHHQDHQTMYRAALAAMRPKRSTMGIKLFALYEYPYVAAWPEPELPGGKFHLPLTDEELYLKLGALSKYRTQFQRDAWCSIDRVREWAKMRGSEIGATAAEAFWAVRGILE